MYKAFTPKMSLKCTVQREQGQKDVCRTKKRMQSYWLHKYTTMLLSSSFSSLPTCRYTHMQAHMLNNTTNCTTPPNAHLHMRTHNTTQHLHMHARTHTCTTSHHTTHTYTSMRIHTCTHAHTHTQHHTIRQACAYTCTHIHTHTHTFKSYSDLFSVLKKMGSGEQI